MVLKILIFIFVSSLTIFVLHNSFRFQIFYRISLRKKKLTNDFVKKTKGEYIPVGYFSTTKKVMNKEDYSKLFKREKVNYNLCYSIVKFKTIDADWELYFHLVKESGKFKEYVFLKCYLYSNWIQSRGNVEKYHSRFETYANKRALMSIFEEPETIDHMHSLLKNNGDILITLDKLISFKGLTDSKKVSTTKLMHKIQSINWIKDRVYRPGNIEY